MGIRKAEVGIYRFRIWDCGLRNVESACGPWRLHTGWKAIKNRAAGGETGRWGAGETEAVFPWKLNNFMRIGMLETSESGVREDSQVPGFDNRFPTVADFKLLVDVFKVSFDGLR